MSIILHTAIPEISMVWLRTIEIEANIFTLISMIGSFLPLRMICSLSARTSNVDMDDLWKKIVAFLTDDTGKGGAATHRSGNSSKRQLIKAATHRIPFRCANSSNDTTHRKDGNSSNTLKGWQLIESTIKHSRNHEDSKTGIRSSLALLEAEI